MVVVVVVVVVVAQNSRTYVGLSHTWSTDMKSSVCLCLCPLIDSAVIEVMKMLFK